VDVSSDPERIRVTIADDGSGLPKDWSKPGHFGLRGLTDRVMQLRGTFEVDNGATGGARLIAEIPLGASA
jgi:two-component system sensor histidine kinase UhpB